MTEQEKQEIINAVLSAIRTNSNTINQLTPVTELSDDDSIEISGGKRVTYGVLMGLIDTAFESVLSDYVSNSTFTHDMTVLETALREAMSNIVNTLSEMVINDLVTGGEEVALSAEMGKELNERLEEIEDSGAGGGVQIWVGKTVTDNDTLFIVTNDTPYIRSTPSSYDFGDAAVGGASVQKSFTIKGKNLTGSSITVATTGAGFSPGSNTIPVTDGVANGTVVVTFAPTGSLGERTGTLTLTCGEVTAEIALSGTAVEQVVPIVEFDPASLSFAAAEGSNQTKTLAVSGRNLEGDVVLTSNDTAFELSLNGTTFSSSVTLSPSSGTLNSTVYVRYTAGSSGVTGKTITASSTNMTAVTVGLSGTVAQRLAAGSYFVKDNLKYTVLTDTSTVSVSEDSSNRPSGAVVIPATVNDSGLTVKDSGGNTIDASGLDYSVVEIPENGFWANTTANTNVTAITLPNTIRHIGTNGVRGLSKITRLEIVGDIATFGQYALAGLNLDYLKIAPNSQIALSTSILSVFTTIKADGIIEIGENITEVGVGAFLCDTTMTGRSIICRRTTPPTVPGSYDFNAKILAATLKVPSGSGIVTAYENAARWSKFKTSEGGGGIEAITE